jgi:hypothetical protein
VRYAADERRFVTGRIATPGRFDFQGISPLVSQQLGAKGSRQAMGEFQYAHIV